MSDAPEIKNGQHGGYRAGAGRPKGARNSRPRSPAHTDAIECSKIEKLLSGHYSGDSKLSPTQLKAIELRYSRLRPTLSSIEQTFNDPRDKADPTELAARLAAMFHEKPELFEQVMRIKNASAAPQTSTQAEPTQVTH
jgi:hypothetical protein